MRVLQLLPELNEGGVERGTVELNRELSRLGHESIVISAGGRLAGRIEEDGGRHIVFDVVSKNPLTAPGRTVKLKALLNELDPDIIHARSRVPAWLAYMANRKAGRAFVTTVHGFNSINCYSEIMTRGERVICVSEAVKSYIVKAYSVDEGKISVIPRGVDPEAFDPHKLDTEYIESFRKSYELDGRYVAVAAGRITQIKGLELFIEAVARAKEEIPELTGLIVGGTRSDKEHYRDTLLRMVSDMGLEESLIFVGNIAKMAELYSMSDIVVNCSLKPESFGRSVAEAISMGTPVAAAAHGGVMDIVKPGRTGWLFEPGDSEGLAKAIVASRETKFDGLRDYAMENFSLARMVERTIRVYEELL